MQKKKIFSFLTIAYNCENFIIQHLESIKYQILTFGKDLNFQLIIADDCSTDSTIGVIERWLSENAKLFFKIDLLKAKSNFGTCKNYCAGLRKIEGEYFKALAGDDLYSNENIFKILELLENYDIVLTPPGPFQNNELFYDYKIYSRFFNIYEYANTDYAKLSRWFISIPSTPGVFLRKELITEEVIDFIEKFELIEDRSQNIKIYETNQKLKIYAYEKVCVLYRHHENAITKTRDERIRLLFKQDSIALYEYVLRKTQNYFVKLKMVYKLTLEKLSNRKIAQMLNFSIFFYRVRFLFFYLRFRKELKENVINSYLSNKEYLLSIQR
jgi:glycosyltransferase involved in cell wall biosynthesis